MARDVHIIMMINGHASLAIKQLSPSHGEDPSDAINLSGGGTSQRSATLRRRVVTENQAARLQYEPARVGQAFRDLVASRPPAKSVRLLP
jgi:hypothetical protein